MADDLASTKVLSETKPLTDIVENIKENPDRYGGGSDGGGKKPKGNSGATSLASGSRKKDSNCC